MGADSLQKAIRAAEYVGRQLTDAQQTSLVTYHDWLADEGYRAGGIGPGERDRLWDRHIADSLVFGGDLVGVGSCLDIGSGVGLPGIPLAIAFPETVFTLLDRSGRRCDLMRRVTAILRLDNCVIHQGDVKDVGERFGAIVSRAAIPREEILIHVKQLLEPGGVATIGITRAGTSPETPQQRSDLTQTIVSIPPEVLDSGANLLRIEAT